jgi:hypothetical protein
MKSKDNYTVTVKVGDATIDVRGGESGVVKIVEALSEILRGSRKPIISAAIGQPLPTPTTPIRSTPVDIRSFFEEKSPSSDVEAAAVAAHYNQYLADTEHRRDTINAASLQEAFRLARWPLPKQTAFTLVNARNAGYLDSIGEGQYRLNPVGYNLVEHTLRREQMQKPSKQRAKRRKVSRRR